MDKFDKNSFRADKEGTYSSWTPKAKIDCISNAITEMAEKLWNNNCRICATNQVLGESIQPIFNKSEA